MREDSDVAQARVFAAMLRGEIDVVSIRVENAEHHAGTASRLGDTTGRLWHTEYAGAQKEL